MGCTSILQGRKPCLLFSLLLQACCGEIRPSFWSKQWNKILRCREQLGLFTGNILLSKVSLTHWNGFCTPPQVSLLARIGRFPGFRLNYDSVAGALPLGCWFQGIRACLQNFSFSSRKPKLSPLGHTKSKGNVPAGGTVDQAVRGMCPFREDPHQIIHFWLNPCPNAGPVWLVSRS